MRIVHIISGLGVGGAEMMLYRLIQASQRSGVQHTVICMSSLDLMADRIRALGVEVRMLGMSRSTPNPLRLGRLVDWLRELRPDVIQTWMYHADLFGGIAARIARLFRGRREYSGRMLLTWGLHQTEFPSRRSGLKLALTARLCASLSSWLPDSIVCCGDATRRSHILGGYAASRMNTIFNGFDVDLFEPGMREDDPLREALGLAPATQLVGIVGRYDPAKDYANFVSAIGLVSRSLPECHFVMIGKGLESSNAELRLMVEQAGVAKVCHLMGPRNDIHLLLPALDVFCLSSRSEGVPTVVGEAMASGVPCVATDVGDTALLVGDTGVIVPPGTPDALATGMCTLLSMTPDERASRGELARMRMKAAFSIERCWSGYRDLYLSKLASTHIKAGIA